MKTIMRFVYATICAVVLLGIPFVASAQLLTRQLQLGMSGSDVSVLQTFLARDASIYPQGLVTGYFGTLTKTAVANFQSRNGISAVGRVGPLTLVAINNQLAVGLDNRAPFIGPVSINTSSNAATVSWNTDENSSAVVYYSTSPLPMTEGSATTGVVIGGTSVPVNSNFQISHSANIYSLTPNTRYYYMVHVKDAQGNESVTWPATFSTSN